MSSDEPARPPAAPSPGEDALEHPELQEERHLAGSPHAEAAGAALLALTRATRSTLYDPANEVVCALIADYRDRFRAVLEGHGVLVLASRGRGCPPDAAPEGLSRGEAAAAVAILQHHRDPSDPLGAGLFGRVLRVAEDYDSLSRRSGKLSPTLALAAMLKWAGMRYDPAILQLLINALGAYPPGTLLRLPDGRVVRPLQILRALA